MASQVEAVFGDDGVLARDLPGFLPREGQRRMAAAIARTVDHGGVLVVEAGTGIGKTYAYLVPALLSGARVLVSTATKALQDQLFSRDLPQLVRVLGLPVRTALLKGRASYLCLHRLETSRQSEAALDRRILGALSRVERWAPATQSGDLAELAGLDERSPVLPLVTSTRDNCLGAQCPRARACHVNQARREALAADVVVVNHHLFFADLAVRESGMAELLPSVQVAVFDEAHQLNETGLQFLGRNLGSAQLLDFVSDLLAACLQHARGVADWPELAARVEHGARELRLLAGRPGAKGARVGWGEAAPDGLDPQAWADALQALHDSLATVAGSLAALQESGPELARLAERAAQLQALAGGFMQARAPESVRWLEVGRHLRLIETPLDIARAMRERVLAPVDQPDSRRALVFTSATLGDDERLQWFTEPAGLQDAQVLRMASPFDYPRQAALYVARSMPPPGEGDHALAVADLVARAVQRLGGRTLVLTTTLRALDRIAELLASRLPPDGAIEVLAQGQGPKRELLDRLRGAGGDGRRGCVLVGSASFWEGVDIPGQALQLVVIDKLPFPPPNDPLVEARAARLRSQGRNPFQDYFLPEAAVALKQGAGRLIRHESDRGLLLLCDPRLATMSYGRRLLAALPPMQRLASEAEFFEALDALTRTSTTATGDSGSPW